MASAGKENTDIITLLKRSKQVHVNWYRQTYPDVAATGLHPAEHYLHYGAAMGRNPGKGFDTRFYLDTYPEVAESGLNPLQHYVLYGQDKDYLPRPQDLLRQQEGRIHDLRDTLFSGEDAEEALADLARMAGDGPLPQIRALAARDLALWHLRAAAEDSVQTALDWLAEARKIDTDPAFRRTLVVIGLLCFHRLGRQDEAEALFDAAALAGELGPDAYLVWSNFQTTPEDRCLWISQALARHGVAPVAPTPAIGPADFDRLTGPADLPTVTRDPTVTVIVTAGGTAGTLPTTLRGLTEQTWKTLEIIVIDDGSAGGSADAAAAADPRIQVIRMTKADSPLAARNRALDAATGEFVTFHEADVWSHPRRIQVQTEYLLRKSHIMGCIAEQARMGEDLSFADPGDTGQITAAEAATLLYRRAPVHAALGPWEAESLADNDALIQRIQAEQGKPGVYRMPTGPLSFQRAPALP